MESASWARGGTRDPSALFPRHLFILFIIYQLGGPRSSELVWVRDSASSLPFPPEEEGQVFFSARAEPRFATRPSAGRGHKS